MATAGKWLGQFLGKWLGTADGASPGPNYVDAALVVQGVGTSQLSPVGGLVAQVSEWLLRTRRRLRR